MQRREFIALSGASVALPFAVMAQEPGRTYRLGFLVLAPREAPLNVHFLDELRRLGFVEGQNLTVEFRTYGNVDLISQYAAELVNARVDAIVVAGEEGIRALQQATKTIPIVAIAADLLGSGFVNSLARPDANTTGVSILASEVNGKRLDILIEAVPGLRLMASSRPTRAAMASNLAHCRRRRVHTESSLQFIVSSEARRSQQLSTVRGHREQQR
jgi:putative ABC transport system substrate-binding protein